MVLHVHNETALPQVQKLLGIVRVCEINWAQRWFLRPSLSDVSKSDKTQMPFQSKKELNPNGREEASFFNNVDGVKIKTAIDRCD